MLCRGYDMFDDNLIVRNVVTGAISQHGNTSSILINAYCSAELSQNIYCPGIKAFFNMTHEHSA